MSVAACPDCGRPLLPGAPPGLCTACLLRLGDGESAPEATREAADLGGGVPAPAEQPGDRIGRYRLLEAIGEGGWGVVYVAEQEAPVRRRVALKVIKLGMDTKAVVARFEAERQALALMDHPHIARVLDAGATERGRPYFVMELVRGMPITRFCCEQRLDRAAQLGLFIKVCHGIQHAHQKGIIHRDLKPSNILVTLQDGVPVPKVIDFGIAKATEGKLTEATVYTQWNQFIGTPAYMSPEQVEFRGLDVDTRTDIYSLGVLLYEILTGRTPFEGEELLSQGLEGMRRTIREQEPVRPSTCLSRLRQQGQSQSPIANRRGQAAPAKAKSEIRNPESGIRHQESGTRSRKSEIESDLDWITMKCLEKDRTRRYETARDLALDLERHLDGQPVLARPPTVWYRVAKYTRRNKTFVGAVTAVALALTLGTIVSVWQAVRAREERTIALESQAAEMEQRRVAEAAQQRAEVSELQARRNLYVAEMALAFESLDRGHLGQARELRDRAAAAARVPDDLRGWEWRHLWDRTRGDDLFILGRHEPMAQVALWLDEGRVLSAGKDGWVNLWDVERRQPLDRRRFPDRVNGLAISPDGSRVGIGLGNGHLALIEVAGWRTLWEITNAHLIGHVVFAPDSTRLAAGGGGRVSLIRAADGQVELTTGGEGVGAAADAFKGGPAFSRDSRFLVRRVLGEPSLGILDLERGVERMASWPGGPHVYAFEFSPDGHQLAVGEGSGITVFAWPELQLITQLGPFSRDTFCLAFSPDGTTLASGGGDQMIRLFDTRTWSETAVFRGHEFEIWSVAFSPDGQRLVSAAKDDTVRLWSAQPRRRTAPWQHLGDRVRAGYWEGGGLARLLATDGREYRVLDVASGTVLRTGGLPATLVAAAPSAIEVSGPDNVALGFPDGRVVTWNVATDSATWSATNRSIAVTALAGPAGSRCLAVAYEDGQIEIRDSAGAVRANVTGPRMPPWQTFWNGLAISRDGQVLAAGAGGASTLCIWNLPDSTPRLLELRHREGLLALFLSEDGRHLVTTSFDGLAYLWAVNTDRQPRRFSGSLVGFHGVAFSPDQSRLALLGGASEVSVWDVASGLRMATLPVAHGRHFLGWYGDVLATVGREEGLRVWRAPTWEEIEGGR